MRLLALLLFAATAAHAQTITPNALWTSVGASAGDAEALAVDYAVTRYTPQSVASVGVAGAFAQTLAFGQQSVTAADADSSDAFVALLDGSGAALWVRRIGAAGASDEATAVAVTPATTPEPDTDDGSVYVAGSFAGTATIDGGAEADVTLTSRGGRDGFLAKYSAAGDLLWAQIVGGPGDDGVYSVALNGGALVIGGRFADAATWGDGAAAIARTSSGGTDGFVARYDADGAVEAVITLGGAEDDEVRDAAWDRGFASTPDLWYAAGLFRGTAALGLETFQSRGGADAFGLAFEDDGTVVLAFHLGGPGRDEARGLLPGPLLRDAFQVVGSFEGTATVGEQEVTSAGGSDAFNGSAGFSMPQEPYATAGRVGGPGDDAALGIATARGFYGDYFGDVPVVVGRTGGPVTFPEQSAGPIVTLPEIGAGDGLVYSEEIYGAGLFSATLLGGTGSDRATAVSTLPDQYDDSIQQAVVVGSFEGTAAVGGLPVSSAGGRDVFVALFDRLSPIYVAAEPTPEASAPMRVSPNPTRGAATVRLTLAEAGSVTVEAFDALGRSVARLHAGPLAAGEAQWTLPAGLPAGVYVVRAWGAVAARQTVTVIR